MTRANGRGLAAGGRHLGGLPPTGHPQGEGLFFRTFEKKCEQIYGLTSRVITCPVVFFAARRGLSSVQPSWGPSCHSNLHGRLCFAQLRPSRALLTRRPALTISSYRTIRPASGAPHEATQENPEANRSHFEFFWGAQGEERDGKGVRL